MGRRRTERVQKNRDHHSRTQLSSCGDVFVVRSDRVRVYSSKFPLTVGVPDRIARDLSASKVHVV